jgi:hypothetical protein
MLRMQLKLAVSGLLNYRNKLSAAFQTRDVPNHNIEDHYMNVRTEGGTRQPLDLSARMTLFLYQIKVASMLLKSDTL